MRKFKMPTAFTVLFAIILVIDRTDLGHSRRAV